MSVPTTKLVEPDATLVRELIDSLDRVFGLHPGFRPAHAKGAFCSGTFTPSPEAAKLTRAPHATRPSTPVIVRYSDSTGIPNVPDNDPNASPRGIAIRFHLGDHVHTDIIGHSFDGFPVRTGEEFVQLFHAIAASGPDAAKPTALDQFLASHPRALHFVTAPKPIPSSFARESFFAVTAFQFLAADGTSRFGRFRIRPVAGNDFLDDATAAKQSATFLFDELNQRIAREPIQFGIFVQIPNISDVVDDATVNWPADRPEIAFGTVTLTKRENDADPELKRIIFDPVPRVDGIEPSADPIIGARSALYLASGRRRRSAATA